MYSIEDKKCSKAIAQLPYDAGNYVTELYINSTHCLVSYSKNSTHINEQEESFQWWGSLLRWDVFPHLNKIVINASQVPECVNYSLAHTGRPFDVESLRLLDEFAKSVSLSQNVNKHLEIHLLEIDEEIISSLPRFPHLLKCVHTISLHDNLDQFGDSTMHKMVDFTEAVLSMPNLQDLSIKMGFQVSSDFTKFFMYLNQLKSLKRLKVSYSKQPIVNEQDLYYHLNSSQQNSFKQQQQISIIPESLKTLSCPFSFLRIIVQSINNINIDLSHNLRQQHEQLSINLSHLTVFVDERTVSLKNAPLSNLQSLKVYAALGNGNNNSVYHVEGLRSVLRQNCYTLKQLCLSRVTISELVQLMDFTPQLEQLHIGGLINNAGGSNSMMPIWGIFLEYVLPKCPSLKDLTVNVSSIRLLMSQSFGKLLLGELQGSGECRTRGCINDNAKPAYPSRNLEKVTIRLNPYEQIRKMPHLFIDVTDGITDYDLTKHAVFHERRLLDSNIGFHSGVHYDGKAKTNYNRNGNKDKFYSEMEEETTDYEEAVPQYLWIDENSCSAHVVFDVQTICQDIEQYL